MLKIIVTWHKDSAPSYPKNSRSLIFLIRTRVECGVCSKWVNAPGIYFLWLPGCDLLLDAKRANSLWEPLYTMNLFLLASLRLLYRGAALLGKVWMDTVSRHTVRRTEHNGYSCMTGPFWNWFFFSFSVFGQVQCRYHGSVPSPQTKCPTTLSKYSFWVSVCVIQVNAPFPGRLNDWISEGEMLFVVSDSVKKQTKVGALPVLMCNWFPHIQYMYKLPFLHYEFFSLWQFCGDQ